MRIMAQKVTNLSFDSYIQGLQNPHFLLKGCEIFYKKYESYVDEVAESIWQSFLRGGQRPSERLILGAAEIILIKWNCPYLFQSKSNELIYTLQRDRISKDLESAYNSVKSQLSRLYNLHLGDPQFVNYLEIIKQVYLEFRDKYTIQMVGASKALHFIHPDLFVPWDSKIRENYHYNDPLHNKEHMEGSPECYADFMKTCNTIAKAVISKISRDRLARAHPAYKMLGHIRTVAKMIDECNYCWFRKNERWTHV